MAKTFQESEYEASVSDQDGLLRSRVPTPMLKAMKARHGDLIHYTMTGPDSVEIKILRGRGQSGERPKLQRAAPSGNGGAKKGASAKSKSAGKKGGGKPATKGGAKKKVRFEIPKDLFS